MRVGFYLNTNHLNTWDWEAILDGRVALSGTDGTTFRVVHALASQSEIETTLLTTVAGTSPSATPASQVVVEDFSKATHYAHNHHFDALVFINDERREIIDGVYQADRLCQPCIAWCKNGPWSRMATLYSQRDAVKRVLCVTHPHADLFRDRPVFEKIEVMYSGIDTAWYRPTFLTPREPRTACYIGALTPDKGFHHLARAWPKVRSSFPEARLLVIGSAQLYHRNADLGPLNVASPPYEYDALIPHLGATRESAKEEHGVEFRGLVPPLDLKEVLHASDVGVVNPNTDPANSLETFCVTAVEMQATETPVVGGNRGGLRETVQDGESGLLIDDSDQLAPTLCRLFDQPEKAHRMGKRGYGWVSSTFDLTQIVTHWERVFEAIANGEPPNPPPFSSKWATTKTMIREGIRRIHFLAGEGRFHVLDRLLDEARGANVTSLLSTTSEV